MCSFIYLGVFCVSAVIMVFFYVLAIIAFSSCLSWAFFSSLRLLSFRGNLSFKLFSASLIIFCMSGMVAFVFLCLKP